MQSANRSTRFPLRRLLAALAILSGMGCTSDPPVFSPSSDATHFVDEPDIASWALVAADGRRYRLDGSSVGSHPDLVSAPAHNAFWFAWSVFHPGTELWGLPNVAEATIMADPSGDCTVPCDEMRFACSGRDCIPALNSPAQVQPDDVAETYFLQPTSLVIGVVTSEGPRAYPHAILWWHEIINEEVGGDAFAVTLCPLTGSGVVYDRRGFIEGQTVELGVSGLLYNSNLIMFDRGTESLWSQMRLESLSGSEIGAAAPVRGALEMTWAAWLALHPDTTVVGANTGHVRTYNIYPYRRNSIEYRDNHDDTFRPTNPVPDPAFRNKDLVLGVLIDGATRAYPWSELEREANATVGIVADELGGAPLAIVFHTDSGFVHAFDLRSEPGIGLRLVRQRP